MLSRVGLSKVEIHQVKSLTSYVNNSDDYSQLYVLVHYIIKGMRVREDFFQFILQIITTIQNIITANVQNRNLYAVSVAAPQL